VRAGRGDACAVQATAGGAGLIPIDRALLFRHLSRIGTWYVDSFFAEMETAEGQRAVDLASQDISEGDRIRYPRERTYDATYDRIAATQRGVSRFSAQAFERGAGWLRSTLRHEDRHDWQQEHGSGGSGELDFRVRFWPYVVGRENNGQQNLGAGSEPLPLLTCATAPMTVGFIVMVAAISVIVDSGCRRDSRRRVDVPLDDDSAVVARGQIAALHLSALQPVINLGENPEFILTVSNTSPRPLFVNKRLSLNGENEPNQFRDIWMRVLGPDGFPVKYSTAANVGFVGREDYTVLLPGSAIEKHMTVDEFKLEQPGVYIFKAWYLDGNTSPPVPSGAVHLAEELQSEQVKIEVVRGSR
jgi:hypothetical protein